MNILSLDIGSSQIKCCVTETKWKGWDIVYQDSISVPDHLQEIPDGYLLSPGQLHCLAEIHKRYTHNIDRLVVNIPLALYSLRMMSFPFKDKKKISAAVSFQIEDEIPFNIEDCILSSHIFPTKTKESHVMAGIAPIASLQKFLDELKSVGIEPDALVNEEAAYSSLLGLQKNLPPNKSIALVNFGHRKSSIAIYRERVPVLHRTSMIGGLNITRAIAKKYEVGMHEAEVAKIDKAFIATPNLSINPEQQIFSDVIAGALDPLLHDFDQALMAYTSKFNQQVDSIMIYGGTSLLPGLVDALNIRWNRRVMPFHILTQIPHVAIRPQKPAELALPTAISLGLSQIRSDHRTSINFRSGVLKRIHQGFHINWNEVVGPLKLAFVVYVFAVISLSFQLLFLKRDLSQLEAKQEASIKSVLSPPNSSAMMQLKANPTRVKQSVDKKVAELQAQLNDGSGNSARSVLDLVQNLSKSVGRSTVLEIKDFKLVGQQLTMNLESPTQKDAETALKILGSIPSLVGAKAGPIEPAPIGNRKKYSISLQTPAGREATP